ncbi:MAG: IS110 family transposase, partial [Gemmatimonadetes bacterium]|nr:IS110 family transposase [Gemmatimonadota bacterium]
MDLAKSVFQVAESRPAGRVDAQHRLSRAGLLRHLPPHEPVEVLMEACGTAHYWGR